MDNSADAETEEPAEPLYYTKKFFEIVHSVIKCVFSMIIVTIEDHPFDKSLEEWYSIIVFFCKNPYYFIPCTNRIDFIKEKKHD